MKKLYKQSWALAFLLMLAFTATAQQRTVTGKVSDPEGTGMPGVNLVVKGTSTGTATDANGNYSITVPDDNSVLIFSFIGYATQEISVGSRSSVDVSMEISAETLSEVVVTALGIEKETKALGYSVTNVKGEELTKAREINIGNALVGKIAGVNSSAPATGPGGSSRVTIRGNSSLNFDNQPLYVINGIQMNNDNLGSAGMWGGADMGDGLSSINPDDVEDITVLKGGAASALYGQRGRNGVILITTKSGKGKKGLGIELNSNSTFESINNFTDFQHQYGQGTLGNKVVDDVSAQDNAFNSWGPELDGSTAPLFDGQSHPYSYVSGDNLKDFYVLGHTYNNTLSITGSSDAGNYRLSIGTLRNSSVYRKSDFDRTSVNLDVNYKLSPKWTGHANINYNKDKGNRSNVSDSPGNGNYAILFLPANFPGSLLAPGYDAYKNEIIYNSNAFDTNPYFAANRFQNNTRKDRILSLVSLRYNPTEWLYIQGRITNDFFTFNQESITPTGTAYRPAGSLDAQNTTNVNETNSDFLVGINKNITSDITIGATIGGNILQQRTKQITINASGLAFPFLYNPSSATTRNANVTEPQKQVQSIYASAELAYKDFLFLNLTDRNDWSSTLPAENNSYNYYSANLSYVFTEMFKVPMIDFGKVRIGYSRVGGDAPVFSTSLYYGTNGAINGHPIGNIPSASPTTPNALPNPKLEPLQVNEFEIGGSFKFLNNRVFLDVAYYDKETINDIVPVTASQSSGYDAAFLNIGKIENKGIELLIGGSVVKTLNFNWTTSLNYTHNKNNVVELAAGLTSISMAQSRTTRGFIHNVVGQPFSQVMVYDYQRGPNGELVLDGSGLPLANDFLTAKGTGIHPITGGWSNDISFKNITLSFLIDFKSGGVIYSGTNARAYLYGLHQETLNGRETGVDLSGIDVNGDAVSSTVTAQNYYGRLSSISAIQVYDADFIKMRSVSLTYNFPTAFFRNKIQGLSVSLVGRNLFYINKKTDNIDPESNYTNGNAQGLEFTALPTVKSYGINLNVKF